MKIPEGMTEQEVLDIIERVAIGLGYKFRFGYHSQDDMKQEARIEAIKGLEKYEPSKGKLNTFLYTHVKNRLANFKRDNYERLDKPCLHCPLKAYDPECAQSDNQCTAYQDKLDCKPYNNWASRNSAKKNIMSPVGIENVRDEHEDSMKEDNDIVEQIHNSHLIDLISDKIPVNLRAYWIKLSNDIPLKKQERERLLAAVREILEEAKYGP